MNVLDYVPAFTAEQWAGLAAYVSAASAVGTFAQAFIAFFGLWFVGYQIRDARRATDVQNLLAFYKSITDAELSFLNAKDINDKDRAFYELVNLLETHAMALRGRIYVGVTREAVELKLVDACSFIELSEFWHDRLNAGRSTEAAFKDLFRFIEKRRRKIDKVKRVLQATNTSDVAEQESPVHNNTHDIEDMQLTQDMAQPSKD